jgi:hypothetical protein
VRKNWLREDGRHGRACRGAKFYWFGHPSWLQFGVHILLFRVHKSRCEVTSSFFTLFCKSPICWVRRQRTAHWESAPRTRSFFNLSFLSGERVALTFIFSNGGDAPTDKGITVQAKVKGECVVDVCVCARAHNPSFVCAIYMTIYMTYIYIAIYMTYIYIAHTQH